jgi:hypothetical protein
MADGTLRHWTARHCKELKMRTKGAIDRKKRKSRRDKKKRYTKHNGKFIPYKSKRNKNDPIKLWFWQRVSMNPESVKHFSRKTRPYMKKIITKFNVRVDVDPQSISNKEKIEQLALDVIGYEGTFLIMGFSKGKNSWGVKPVKLCRVVIKESSEGLKARMTDNYRLFRYFFWEK